MDDVTEILKFEKDSPPRQNKEYYPQDKVENV